MPPLPKPAHLRQRRNVVPTAAHLPSAESSASNAVPRLPMREPDATGKPGRWHPMVTKWWASVWRSPMASEYQDADMRGGLFQLATLYQDFWTADSAAKRLASAAEIRLQEVRFGLSPIDRSRLRWTIDAGETAAERTEARRELKAPKKERDPRSVLKAV